MSAICWQAVAVFAAAAVRCHRRRVAAAQPVALGHVRQCRHRGEGGDDRARLRLAGDLDDLARRRPSSSAVRRTTARNAAGLLESRYRAGAGRKADARRRRCRGADHPVAAARSQLSGGIVDDGFKERVALRLERVEAAMSRQIAPRHRRARHHRRAPRRSSACSARSGAS